MFGFSWRGKGKGRGSKSIALRDVKMKGLMGILGWLVRFIGRGKGRKEWERGFIRKNKWMKWISLRGVLNI